MEITERENAMQTLSSEDNDLQAIPLVLVDNELYTVICKKGSQAQFAALDLIEMGLQNLGKVLELIEDKTNRKEIITNLTNSFNKIIFDNEKANRQNKKVNK